MHKLNMIMEQLKSMLSAQTLEKVDAESNGAYFPLTLVGFVLFFDLSSLYR